MKKSTTTKGELSLAQANVRKRIFVFKEKIDGGQRHPYLWAIPEDKITEIKSQSGSHNVYLEINGHDVVGSFDDFIELLGEKINAF